MYLQLEAKGCIQHRRLRSRARPTLQQPVAGLVAGLDNSAYCRALTMTVWLVKPAVSMAPP